MDPRFHGRQIQVFLCHIPKNMVFGGRRPWREHIPARETYGL